MEKNAEACMKCKYAIQRCCINKRCEDCKMRNKERDACKCTTVVMGQDCPYYEPAEEVNK